MPATLTQRTPGRARRARSTSASVETSAGWRERAARLVAEEIGFLPNDRFANSPLTNAQLLQQATELLDRLAHDASRVRAAGDSMPAHLTRLCETPLLRPQDERDLFLYMNWLRFRANSLRARISPARPDEPLVREFQRLLQVSEQIKDRLIRANVRLVISIVKNFTDARNRFDDLLSDGMMALMRAVEKFDFDRGFRFSTYATMVVRRHICRQIKDAQKQRTRFATGVLESPDSVDLPAPDSTPAGEATSLSVSQLLVCLMNTLDDRERFIIRKRFAFDGGPRKQTLSSLAHELGVCKERVRQLEQRALRKLRDLAFDSELTQLELA